MSTISVIVPVYKVELYLHRCVDSILNQSFRDFELILVDDGSPDNCGAICDHYAKKDSRIQVIHQENAGVSAARNAGIEWALENSESQWISFVDSDDWIHKDYLKILLDTAQGSDAQISMCDCIWTADYMEDSEVACSAITMLEPEQALVQHHAKCTPPWGKLIRKSLMEQLRFPVGMRYEDAAISHILTLSADRVAVCPEKLYYYYSNPNGYTRVSWTTARLVALDVHEQRMDFFSKNGYNQAYQKEQLLYMEVLTENLQTLMDLLEEGLDYRNYFQQILEKHQQAFRNARKQGILHFSRDTVWFYVYAAPSGILWKAVRKAQRIYHKIRK